jgi:hypothetical protein
MGNGSPRAPLSPRSEQECKKKYLPQIKAFVLNNDGSPCENEWPMMINSWRINFDAIDPNFRRTEVNYQFENPKLFEMIAEYHIILKDKERKVYVPPLLFTK